MHGPGETCEEASTGILADHQVRVIAWYDNEMGYAARLVDHSGRVGNS